MTCTCVSECTCISNFPEERPFHIEPTKVLKFIGKATGQLEIENSTCINAVKIDRINAFLVESHDHLFQDKVVKQGVIRKEVFYVNPLGELRFITEEIPFRLTFEIPGLYPNEAVEVQNHLIDIDTDFILVPSRTCFPGCLRQVIVAHFLVIVSQWVQMELVVDKD